MNACTHLWYWENSPLQRQRTAHFNKYIWININMAPVSRQQASSDGNQVQGWKRSQRFVFLPLDSHMNKWGRWKPEKDSTGCGINWDPVTLQPSTIPRCATLKSAAFNLQYSLQQIWFFHQNLSKSYGARYLTRPLFLWDNLQMCNSSAKMNITACGMRLSRFCTQFILNLRACSEDIWRACLARWEPWS